MTLFESINVFCGTNNVLQNIPHIQSEWWNISHNIVSFIWNIVMDLNNVMKLMSKLSKYTQIDT